MKQKRRLFTFLEEENSLARRMDARSGPVARSAGEDPSGFSAGIGPGDRAFSQLGQEMAQATREIRDPHDSSLLCSRSRAHPAPSSCCDIRVTLQIVEMRFSPPENADRVYLALVPCFTTSPVTRNCKQ